MDREMLFDLLKIGFTKGESKVYVSLLEIGTSTVGPIVKKSGVAYSNVYNILDRLIEKGAVTSIVHEKTKHFQAVNPKNLLYYINKKETELASQKKNLLSMLPSLESMQNTKQKQDAELFMGLKGLRSAYEIFLGDTKKGDESLYFFIYENEYAEESDTLYLSLAPLLKRLSIKGIANEHARKSEFLKKSKYVDNRYASFPIPGNIEICNDKVLIISWKSPMIAVLIRSQSVADNFREYFYSSWKKCKP